MIENQPLLLKPGGASPPMVWSGPNVNDYAHFPRRHWGKKSESAKWMGFKFINIAENEISEVLKFQVLAITRVCR